MKVIVNITTNLIPKLILGIVFVLVLIGVIAYARGYRFNVQDGSVTSTGILSVNSSPQPATVYVNGELKGATDVNLTLPYGKYTIEVKKEGYTDWKKTISLKGETVMSINAHLYSKNPSLTPLTNLGITKAIPLGNTDKIILVSQTGDVLKDGLYLFDAQSRPISIFPPLTALLFKSILPEGTDLRSMQIDFDPKYQQGIITFVNSETNIAYLISLDEENTEPLDVTNSKENILSAWDEDKNKEVLKVIETLPRKIRPLALDSFEVITLSPDEKRLMYLAKKDATLPSVINPPLIGANQTPEERSIKAGSLYIYDKKEDKNYRIPIELDADILSHIPTPTAVVTDSLSVTPKPVRHVTDVQITRYIQERILWYPTSDYIAVKDRNQIVLMEYDGDNKQIVYAGPFSPDFFAIASDWNLLVIINLNPNNNQYGDLYSVGVK